MPQEPIEIIKALELIRNFCEEEKNKAEKDFIKHMYDDKEREYTRGYFIAMTTIRAFIDSLTFKPEPSIVLTTAKPYAKTKPRTWSRKGTCPSCGVSQGSTHNKKCTLTLKPKKVI